MLIAIIGTLVAVFIMRLIILLLSSKKDSIQKISDRIQLLLDKRIEKFKKQKNLIIEQIDELYYYSPKKTYSKKEDVQVVDYNSIQNIENLEQTLNFKNISTIDLWNIISDKSEFSEDNPYDYFNKKKSTIKKLIPPDYFHIEEEPCLQNFLPKFSILDTILIIPKLNKIVYSRNHYKYSLDKWRKELIWIRRGNKKLLDIYQEAQNSITERTNLLDQKYKNLETDWLKRRNKYNEKKSIHNQEINALKTKYLNKKSEAIQQFNEKLLENVKIFNLFPNNRILQYNPDTKTLLIEYQLPNLDDIPTLKELKYIKSKNGYKEIHINEREHKKIYDDVIYRITLRIIYILFIHDEAQALESIVFNGWTKFINKATGFEETACIVSIQVLKKDFTKINITEVDPKICFRSFKGISCSALSTMTPIKPIQEIDKKDSRFIESRNIETESGTNIAAMNWEDFEHLIRELFEKEFKVVGGEVKVTQASRDGGVDAIAFDPDPLRGGKIIIQAKRYTNTVGIAAVRDLYGTVINEGAIKGILVTTADYGAEAYNFTKDKPLTLLNGSNLLHLLEKHGHDVKIDIREAKQILKQHHKPTN